MCKLFNPYTRVDCVLDISKYVNTKYAQTDRQCVKGSPASFEQQQHQQQTVSFQPLRCLSNGFELFLYSPIAPYSHPHFKFNTNPDLQFSYKQQQQQQPLPSMIVGRGAIHPKSS